MLIKTDILFTGFYGQSNTGDDAFVEVSSWGAKKYWQKRNNRFLAKQNKLPQTIIPAKGYPFTIPKTYKFQAEQLLKGTDAFVFAGGSTIHSRLSVDNIRMKALELKFSNRKPLKIGAVGVSIGPFKSIDDERAVEQYLKQMDFLAVRDQASFDFVSSLSLSYKPVNAFDLAALLPDIYDYKKDIIPHREKKVIGISVCPYESLQHDLDTSKEERRNNMMIEMIKIIDQSIDVHFKFYVINGNDQIGDKNITMQTVNKAKPRSYDIVEYNRSTMSVWSSIAGCDFVISTRLHASIFACFAETPFMLNEYHRKCSDFLDNVGYEDKYRLYDSNYDINEKANQIVEVITKNNFVFPKMMEDMKLRALLNFTQIDV